jgi:cell division protein FtsL
LQNFEIYSINTAYATKSTGTEKMSLDIPDIEAAEKIKIIDNSTDDKCTEKKIKKVT